MVWVGEFRRKKSEINATLLATFLANFAFCPLLFLVLCKKVTKLPILV